MANDSDIFGEAASGKDGDIFKDLPDAVAKPEAQGRPSWENYAKRYLKDTFEGFMWGGPMGAAIGSSKISNEAIEAGAYKAGGAVTDIATDLGASPETAAKAGYLTNVGVQAVPVIAGGELAKLATPAVQAGARSLMQSAIKPTIADLKTGDAARAIDTLLSEGVSPTRSGIERMRGMVDDLGEQVKNAIANSSETISKGDVGKRLLDTYNKFKNQVSPSGDLEAIRKAWLEFRNHPDLAGLTQIPVQVAQRLKQGTYAALGSKPYGEVQGASVEAQKALARGLKEEISSKIPAVAPLNKKQAELLNAIEVAERRALMEGNKHPLGLSPLTGDPRLFTAMLMDRSAWLKSLAARGLYASAPQTGNIARFGIGDYMLQHGQLDPMNIDLTNSPVGALYGP